MEQGFRYEKDCLKTLKSKCKMQNCRIRRWRMADFIIVFMAHNTLSKGELRLALRKESLGLPQV